MGFLTTSKVFCLRKWGSPLFPSLARSLPVSSEPCYEVLWLQLSMSPSKDLSQWVCVERSDSNVMYCTFDKVYRDAYRICFSWVVGSFYIIYSTPLLRVQDILGNNHIASTSRII